MSLDEPQVDTRPPGYGCGYSFGMLGTSRLCVRPATVPEGYEAFSEGIVVPYLLEGSGSPFWFAQWKAEFEELDVSVFLSLLDPHDGWWRLNVDINAAVFSDSGGATREFTNFIWQRPAIALTDSTTANWGNILVYRVPEWQQPSIRFPGVRIPEDV